MRIRRARRRLIVAVLSWLALPASALAGQDTLARAKVYYASAAYEEALQVLDQLHSKAAPGEATEVAAYQMLCFVALGRSDEAKQAIEAIVRVDPLYHPPEAQVSPRVRALFEDVRRPLLPEVVRQSYSKAKDAFDRKEMSAAASGFDKVLALLDEMGGSDAQGVADLRTLAGGFRELSRAAVVAASAPKPEAAPAPPPSTPAAENDDTKTASVPKKSEAEAPRTYSTADAGVSKPVVVARPLPEWNPKNPAEAKLDFYGVVELLIAEDGKVLSAVLTKKAHPSYDDQLLKAATEWKFRPAMKDGMAVRYRYTLEVHLVPPGR
jgi:tetratricopeptide (TPR) repeat protein